MSSQSSKVKRSVLSVYTSPDIRKCLACSNDLIWGFCDPFNDPFCGPVEEIKGEI